MGNQASAKALTQMMNAQALTTSMHLQQQQQEMQMMSMGMQQQIAASNMQAIMQFVAMQQQQQTMMAAQAKQQEMADNLARAHVPDPIKGAGLTLVGDMRTGVEEARKSSKLSELKGLSFLPRTPGSAPAAYTGTGNSKTLVLA
jgi:hypothetical protein